MTLIDVLSFLVLFLIGHKLYVISNMDVLYNELFQPLNIKNKEADGDDEIVQYIVQHPGVVQYMFVVSIAEYVVIVAGLFTSYSIFFLVMLLLGFIRARSARTMNIINIADVVLYLCIHVGHMYLKISPAIYLKEIWK